MKPLFTAPALCALVALSGAAFAQDGMGKTPTVKIQEMDGKKVVIVSKDATGTDMYKTRWAFFNADKREVARFKAKGFSDADFKAIANIALRTGLDTEYVARQVKEVGHPLSVIAARYNVSTFALHEDIPGLGATSFGIDTTGSMMGGSSMDKPMSDDSGKKSKRGKKKGGAAMASGTVVDVAMSDPQFSTLVAAIKAAGLVDTLNGAGPFTVLAPTNEAFAKLPAGALDDLLKPENKDKLVSILTYHVIPGKIKAADVMGMSNPSMPTTVNGKQLNVKTTAPVMVNNARVIKTDIDASNGVIHVIDTVLMPDAPATP